jgi:hypothetical protein
MAMATEPTEPMTEARPLMPQASGTIDGPRWDRAIWSPRGKGPPRQKNNGKHQQPPRQERHKSDERASQQRGEESGGPDGVSAPKSPWGQRTADQASQAATDQDGEKPHGESSSGVAEEQR